MRFWLNKALASVLLLLAVAAKANGQEPLVIASSSIDGTGKFAHVRLSNLTTDALFFEAVDATVVITAYQSSISNAVHLANLIIFASQSLEFEVGREVVARVRQDDRRARISDVLDLREQCRGLKLEALLTLLNDGSKRRLVATDRSPFDVLIEAGQGGITINVLGKNAADGYLQTVELTFDSNISVSTRAVGMATSTQTFVYGSRESKALLRRLRDFVVGTSQEQNADVQRSLASFLATLEQVDIVPSTPR